jgi:hypothetical protein
MALEEAKGGLLEQGGIIVAEPAGAAAASIGKRDLEMKAGSLPAQAPARTVKVPHIGSPAVNEGAAKVAGLHGDQEGKAVSFDFTVGTGQTPFRIRGSFTIAPVRSLERSKSQ